MFAMLEVKKELEKQTKRELEKEFGHSDRDSDSSGHGDDEVHDSKSTPGGFDERATMKLARKWSSRKSCT